MALMTAIGASQINNTMHNFIDWFRRRSKPLNEIFLFVHLLKCAGTSLLKTFNSIGRNRYIVVAGTKSKQAALDFVRTTMTEKKIQPGNLDLIMGRDVLYGMHDISPRTPFYFTFLRDPIQRYISQYRFWCDIAQDPQRKEHAIKKEQMLRNGKIISLKEFADQGLAANMMTRVLAISHNPPGSPDEWWRVKRDESLSLALEMLGKMSFIGFVERLEDDVDFICQKLRIQPNLQHVNASQSRFDLDEETRQSISQMNDLDITLYQSALSLAAELRQRAEFE